MSSTVQELCKGHVLLLLSLLIQKSQKQGMHFNFIEQMSCQQCRDALMVYWFPIATIIADYIFGGFKCHTVLEIRNLK